MTVIRDEILFIYILGAELQGQAKKKNKTKEIWSADAVKSKETRQAQFMTENTVILSVSFENLDFCFLSNSSYLIAIALCHHKG